MMIVRTIIHRFDKRVGTAIRHLPKWLHPLMFTVSWVGQPIITIPLLFFVGLAALVYSYMGLLVGVIIAGAVFAFNSLVKLTVRRIRPRNVYTESMMLDTFSFPSGHAASSVVVFGLVGYLLMHSLPSLYGIVAAVITGLFIVLIGVSRVYLGAHYPTDVIAGWLIGSVGLIGLLYGVERLL